MDRIKKKRLSLTLLWKKFLKSVKNANDEENNKIIVILTMQSTRILILRHVKMMIIQIKNCL